MAQKAVISLITGMEDPERVTVAFLVAVGAAEQGRPTLMFLTKEAVRLATTGIPVGVACDGCPTLLSADLVVTSLLLHVLVDARFVLRQEQRQWFLRVHARYARTMPRV